MSNQLSFIRRFLAIALSLFLPYHSCANNYQRLLSLSQLIIPHNTPCSPLKKIVLRQQALVKVHRTEPLKISMLEKAIELFHDTPGFYKSLQQYVIHQSPHSQAGYLYEIEKAFSLHENYLDKNNEEQVVIAFHQVINKPDGRKRQFDLIAWMYNSFFFIECKNSNLSGTHPQWRRQFLDQKSIVHRLSNQKCPCNYCVSSSQPIPKKWIRWFQLHDIDTHEG